MLPFLCGIAEVPPNAFFDVDEACARVRAVNVPVDWEAVAVWFPRTASMLFEDLLCALPKV